MTTSLNAKVKMLNQVLQTVATAQPVSGVMAGESRGAAPVVRLRRSRAPQARPTAGESLWRVTMAETRDAVAERALTWALMSAGLAALGWLCYTAVQFLLAWEGLVSWVRAALV